MSKLKILLTGGHGATTAVSFIEEIFSRKRNGKMWKIYWIGSDKAIEGKNVSTIESRFMPKLGVSTHAIIVGRLQRKFTLWTIPSLFKIPWGFLQALYLLKRVSPDVILSFGGYTAFPVIVAGFLLRIPLVLHEQTSAAGLANRLSSIFVNKIAIAGKESQKYFPKRKTVLIGNPLMSRIVKVKHKDNIGEPPVIYITGGSRGSQAINSLIEQILYQLLRKYLVIHQVGYLDYPRFRKIRLTLPQKLRVKYKIYSTIDPRKIHKIYDLCDIVVSRAGANTVSEIMMVKRPAILIPLAINEEQQKNAQFAEKFGIAEVFEQKFLTKEKLIDAIEKLIRNWKEKVVACKEKESPDKYASKRLADLVENLLIK